MAKSKPNEEVKFSDEDMNKIKEFQQKYVDIQMNFGRIEISKNRLEDQFESLDEAHDKLVDDLNSTQTEERSFIAEVNEKYGDGVLDPQTGLFTPQQS